MAAVLRGSCSYCSCTPVQLLLLQHRGLGLRKLRRRQRALLVQGEQPVELPRDVSARARRRRESGGGVLQAVVLRPGAVVVAAALHLDEAVDGELVHRQAQAHRRRRRRVGEELGIHAVEDAVVGHVHEVDAALGGPLHRELLDGDAEAQREGRLDALQRAERLARDVAAGRAELARHVQGRGRVEPEHVVPGENAFAEQRADGADGAPAGFRGVEQRRAAEECEELHRACARRVGLVVRWGRNEDRRPPACAPLLYGSSALASSD
jgi:hypothetical protein